jgi:gluconolactonase
VAASGFGGPDGIAFSADEKRLYVVDTGVQSSIGRDSNVRVFDVNGERLTNDRVFIPTFGAVGRSDGVRTDMDGNVWITLGSGDPSEFGVRCYAPTANSSARSICRRPAPICASAARSGTRLFMCGSTSIYAVYVETQGALLP